MESSNRATAISRKRLQTYRRPVATILGLAVVWWAVLLVPEVSRDFLLDGTENGMLWGFVRVVALVSGASVVFRRMPRASSWKTCLSAFCCLWGGSAAFVLTTMPQWDTSSLLPCLFSAPLLFMAFAWYAVFPMMIVTAIVLSRLDAHAAAAAK
jgi:hypothetical protein